ncbi:hypothetical protein TWF694_004801 [Orbilia ellipsospora]|uniref:Uncharacterized protein n=1 Tax=Orbilia ellipsospora TaxID=2528407 RepID=A0AAV9WYS3_9PEZI
MGLSPSGGDFEGDGFLGSGVLRFEDSRSSTDGVFDTITKSAKRNSIDISFFLGPLFLL